MELSPAWAGIPLGRATKYLGYYIDPTKAQLQGQEVQSKILDRSRLWDWKKSGLHFASVIYNSYLASAAGFKLQLADLNEDMLAVEAVAMRRAVPSVGQIFQQEDLWQLKDTYGMPRNFCCLWDLSLAVKGRIYIN